MFLYHHVPNDQKGDIIYPLNELEQKDPDLYKAHKKKYENLKEQDVEIPGFGSWSDCVNLMPVNPELVKIELEKYGHDTNWAWRFYKIDSAWLDANKLVLMVSKDALDGTKRKFLEFNEENCKELCHITDVTRSRYQQAKDIGEQPFTFAGVTHALYRGSINTADLEIVDF